MKMEQKAGKPVKPPVVQKMRDGWNMAKGITRFAVKHPVITTAIMFGGIAVLAEGCKDNITNNYYNTQSETPPAIDTTRYKLLSKGTLYVGNTLDAGIIQVRLAGVSTAYGTSNAFPAILDILNPNGAVLDNAQVTPKFFYIYKASDQKVYLIYVDETVVNSTTNTSWAKLQIWAEK